MLAAIAGVGRAAGTDAFARIAERSAFVAGTDAARLLPCAGAAAWVAVNLARDTDVELVSAWLRREAPDGAPEAWDAVAAAVAACGPAEADALVAWGRTLGLAVSRVGDAARAGIVAQQVGAAVPLARVPVVVDLSSLWAGPLCTRLLADAGAAVVKVESSRRPDGARSGSPAFFERLHAGKQLVSLDLPSPAGIAALGDLIAGADVVVEASRPRALDQWGISRQGPQVWVAITGHGHEDPYGQWVGFGDDAAASGGLVSWTDGRPSFAAAAIADPLAGMAAAAAVTRALAAGGRWFVDVALSAVAASVARGSDPLP